MHARSKLGSGISASRCSEFCGVGPVLLAWASVCGTAFESFHVPRLSACCPTPSLRGIVHRCQHEGLLAQPQRLHRDVGQAAQVGPDHLLVSLPALAVVPVFSGSSGPDAPFQSRCPADTPRVKSLYRRPPCFALSVIAWLRAVPECVWRDGGAPECGGGGWGGGAGHGGSG